MYMYIVTKPTSGLCELDLGNSEGFLRKLELAAGSVSGMMTTLLRGHADRRTTHATSTANPPTPGFGL